MTVCLAQEIRFNWTELTVTQTLQCKRQASSFPSSTSVSRPQFLREFSQPLYSFMLLYRIYTSITSSAQVPRCSGSYHFHPSKFSFGKIREANFQFSLIISVVYNIQTSSEVGGPYQIRKHFGHKYSPCVRGTTVGVDFTGEIVSQVLYQPKLTKQH